MRTHRCHAWHTTGGSLPLGLRHDPRPPGDTTRGRVGCYHSGHVLFASENSQRCVQFFQQLVSRRWTPEHTGGRVGGRLYSRWSVLNTSIEERRIWYDIQAWDMPFIAFPNLLLFLELKDNFQWVRQKTFWLWMFHLISKMIMIWDLESKNHLRKLNYLLSWIDKKGDEWVWNILNPFPTTLSGKINISREVQGGLIESPLPLP